MLEAAPKMKCCYRSCLRRVSLNQLQTKLPPSSLKSKLLCRRRSRRSWGSSQPPLNSLVPLPPTSVMQTPPPSSCQMLRLRWRMKIKSCS